MQMRIALVSEFFRTNDVKENIKTIKQSLKRNKGFDLFLFGEAFLQGFDALTWDYKTDLKIAITLDSNEIDELKNCARMNKVALGVGYFENYQGNIYSSYLIINKEGAIINNYQRISSGWKELIFDDRHYQEASDLIVGTLNDEYFLVVLGGDLWDDMILKQVQEKVNQGGIAYLFWPNHLDYGLFKWIEEIDHFKDRTKGIKTKVLLVNNCSSTAGGGAAVFEDGKLVFHESAGSTGILDTDSDALCQSCGIPLSPESAFAQRHYDLKRGTNKDGSLSREYCADCYQRGQFTNKEITLHEMIEREAKTLVSCSNNEEYLSVKSRLRKLIPTLKRWSHKLVFLDEISKANPNPHVHRMNLNDAPFKLIQTGNKTVELRLNDPKRKQLKVKDYVVFSNSQTKEEILTRIVFLNYYQDFAELYSHYDSLTLGYQQKESYDYKDMYHYYSDEDIKKYGVVAIGIKVIRSENEPTNFWN